VRKKTEDRRLSFVRAASKLFIERGFGAVTMEAVAAEAGASKATLYGYFDNREALFKASVIEAGKGGLHALEAAKQGDDLRQVLYRLGVSYLELVTRPDVVEINRLIIGEAGRQPEMSRIFYEEGPRETILVINETIEALMDRGMLLRHELPQTGLYFKALCEVSILERQLWGLDPTPDKETIDTAVNRAIDVFLAAFGINKPQR
jgi:TetR/AcrR family transcriptional regulator, mexJK operon transcriptional repressor